MATRRDESDPGNMREWLGVGGKRHDEDDKGQCDEKSEPAARHGRLLHVEMCGGILRATGREGNKFYKITRPTPWRRFPDTPVAYHYGMARHHLFKAQTYREHAKARFGLQLPLFDEVNGGIGGGPGAP
jgi:hypothetical protein